MASLTPAVDQNENHLHIHRGKGVEGSQFGVTQNENLHILKGKAVDGFKAEVPKLAKAQLQERKMLKDLSQARKPVLSAANKATPLKDKSTAAIQETANKAPQINILTDEEISVSQKWEPTDEEISKCRKWTMTDEEISKCVEWAKEGIEYMPFFDMQEFEARVRKEVDMAMFGLREWTDMTFGLEILVKEVPSDTEDTLLLEFELEVFLPTPRASLPKKSGYEEIDELLKRDYDDSMYFDRQIEIKLKEICEDAAAFF